MEVSKLNIVSLYERFRTELISYVTGQFRCNRTDAEDIVQSCFERLSHANSGIHDNSVSQKAYLYRAVHHLAIDRYRKETSFANALENYSNFQQLKESISPETDIDGKKRLQVIESTMKSMPDKRREILIMNRFDNIGIAEIARRLSLSESATRKHLFKAIRDCQRALEVEAE